MDRLARDVRIAFRGFRRTPTFTATAVLILGLGIGMAVAMVTVFHVVLVRPLPVSDQDRIVLPRIIDRVGVPLDIWPERLEALRQDTRSMRDVAGVAHSGAVESPLLVGDQSVALRQSYVTGNFFEVVGAKPALGRLIRPEDDVTGAAPVLVLSFGVWRRWFRGDSSIIGRQVTEPYRRSSYTIVGVAPPGLEYPAGVDAWLPIRPFGRQMVNVVARLAPNATPAMAASELLAFLRRDPQMGTLVGLAHAEAHTFTQTVVGDVRPVLIVVTAAVAVLLVTAGVNVGTLLLLRAAARARALAIRRALGASAGDIARQLLVESGLLGVAGGALGLVVGGVLLRGLVALAPPQLPRLDAISLEGAPVGVAVGVSLLTVLVFGVVPALVASRGDVAWSLRAGSRSGTHTRWHRGVRQSLVAAQVALALIMLAAAGLLARSLERLEDVDLGYRADRLAFLSLSFPVVRYGTSQPSLRQLYSEVAPRLRAVAGVTAITPVLAPPFLVPDLYLGKYVAAGSTLPDSGESPFLPLEIGGPEYFQALGIRLSRGRGFLETDTERAPGVVVVSETVARQLWPGEDPIGKRIRGMGDTSALSQRTVVGVASDVRYRKLRETMPTLYLPWRQYYWGGNLAVRTSGRLSAVLPAMRRAMREVDPGIDLWYAQTADQLLDGPLAQPRLSALLLTGFALASLLLAATGLYGAMASAVREQTREIGVRMALGATPARVRGDVLRRALAVAGVGTGVGVVSALASSRLLASLLYEVRPTDPVALLGACGLLLAVAALAAFVPARQATRIDPAHALRAD